MSLSSVAMLNRPQCFLFLTALVALTLQMTSGQKSLKMGLTIPSAGRSDTIQLSEDLEVDSVIGFLTVKKYKDGSPVENAHCETDNTMIILRPLVDVSKGTFALEVGQQLDHEEVSFLEVLLSCTDNLDPPTTAEETRAFEITDVNDNIPLFRQESLQASLTEGIPIGISILRVVADDPDSEDNGAVVYSILGSNVDDTTATTGNSSVKEMSHADYFRIDPVTGDVFVKEEIDREEITEFLFEVVATDKGSPPLSSSSTVSISVQDINDNEPVLLTFETHVSENEPPGTQAGTLEASDPDDAMNGQVVFLINYSVETSTGGRPAGHSDIPFRLKRDGRLYTTETLDRERRDSYEIEVVVKDKGRPQLSSSGMVTVIVDDANDSPVVTSECLKTPAMSEAEDSADVEARSGIKEDGNFSFTENENNSMVTVDWSYPDSELILYQIEAEDPDVGRGGELVYTVMPGEDTENGPLFGIDAKSGDVFLRRHFSKTDSLNQIVNISVKDMGDPPIEVFCGVSVTFDLNISFLPETPPSMGNNNKNRSPAGSMFSQFSILHIVLYALFLRGLVYLQNLIVIA